MHFKGQLQDNPLSSSTIRASSRDRPATGWQNTFSIRKADEMDGLAVPVAHAVFSL
jgi:hypothetical protein